MQPVSALTCAWRFRTPWEEITLLPGYRVSADDRLTVLPAGLAIRRLREATASDAGGDGRPLLAGILAEIEGRDVDLTRTDTEWLEERVEAALRSGRLVAIATVPVVAGGAPSAAAEGPVPADPAGTVPDRTWIEIRLLDGKDRPLAGHPYELELPDGSSRTGTLGADGTARVDGIDPGTCRLVWKRQRVEAYRRVETEAEAVA